jgi:hypothetical protein
MMRKPGASSRTKSATVTDDIGQLFDDLLKEGPPAGSLAPGRLRPDEIVMRKMRAVPMRRYSAGKGLRRPPRALQLYERGAHLVLSRSRSAEPAGDCQNMIVLSEEFYREIQTHPIPADLEAAKALSSSPAVLDLYMWLSYRCFAARGEERVPLFGGFGLVNQLGSATYARPRKFRERLERWLDLVRMMWPECPASISPDSRAIRRASFPIERLPRPQI